MSVILETVIVKLNVNNTFSQMNYKCAALDPYIYSYILHLDSHSHYSWNKKNLMLITKSKKNQGRKKMEQQKIKLAIWSFNAAGKAFCKTQSKYKLKCTSIDFARDLVQATGAVDLLAIGLQESNMTRGDKIPKVVLEKLQEEYPTEGYDFISQEKLTGIGKTGLRGVRLVLIGNEKFRDLSGLPVGSGSQRCQNQTLGKGIVWSTLELSLSTFEQSSRSSRSSPQSSQSSPMLSSTAPLSLQTPTYRLLLVSAHLPFLPDDTLGGQGLRERKSCLQLVSQIVDQQQPDLVFVFGDLNFRSAPKDVESLLKQLEDRKTMDSDLSRDFRAGDQLGAWFREQNEAKNPPTLIEVKGYPGMEGFAPTCRLKEQRPTSCQNASAIIELHKDDNGDGKTTKNNTFNTFNPFNNFNNFNNFKNLNDKDNQNRPSRYLASDCFDLKKGKRVPSWCDRILYKSVTGRLEPTTILYDRWDRGSMNESDHASVLGIFDVAPASPSSSSSSSLRNNHPNAMKQQNSTQNTNGQKPRNNVNQSQQSQQSQQSRYEQKDGFLFAPARRPKDLNPERIERFFNVLADSPAECENRFSPKESIYNQRVQELCRDLRDYELQQPRAAIQRLENLSQESRKEIPTKLRQRLELAVQTSNQRLEKLADATRFKDRDTCDETLPDDTEALRNGWGYLPRETCKSIRRILDSPPTLATLEGLNPKDFQDDKNWLESAAESGDGRPIAAWIAAQFSNNYNVFGLEPVFLDWIKGFSPILSRQFF